MSNLAFKKFSGIPFPEIASRFASFLVVALPVASSNPGSNGHSGDTMSSGVCHLQNAVIPLIWIRDDAVDSISAALNSVTGSGSKALVLDKQLSGPLGFVVEVALLKRLGVSAMFELSSESLPVEIENVVYFIRSNLQSVRLVAEQVQQYQATTESSSRRRQHYLFIFPRRTLLCEVCRNRNGTTLLALELISLHSVLWQI
jgi:hypothetical protein